MFSAISPSALAPAPARGRALLAALLLLAAGLRFYALAGQSFWADEGNSVALAARPGREIIAAAAADIHPPAYYLLLRLWGGLFGLDEAGARGFSALVGVLLVGALYLLGRRLGGERVGGLAALLAAVHPFLVYYSQEARMYALLALCAAAAALALIDLSSPRASARGAALYLAAATLGLYTHYAFPIHLLALNLIVLWRKARGQKAKMAGWIGVNLAAALLFLPWLPTALRQLSSWPGPAATLSPAAALVETLRLFTCGPIPCPDSPLIPLAAGLALALALFGLWPTRRGPQPALLPLLWLAAPLAAMLLFGIFSPVFFKFLLIALPAWLLLVAFGLEKVSSVRCQVSGATHHAPRTRPYVLRFTFYVLRFTPHAPRLFASLLLASLLLASLLSLDRYYHDPAVARDDYRSIAAYVAAVAAPGDFLLLNAPGQIDVVRQYDHGPATIVALPRSRPLDPAATQAEMAALLARRGRIFAIYWAVEQADPAGLIESTLAAQSFKAWDSWVGHLRFVAYSAAPPPAATPFVRPPRFGDAILLEEAGFSAGPLPPGEIAQALLRWSSTQSLAVDYTVTLQLLDAANQIVAQVDSPPVGGTRPTTTWQPDEKIDDPYGLPIPLATSPGEYTLILALYDAAGGQRLPVATAAGLADHLTLGVIRVDPPVHPPPLAVLPIRYRAETAVGPFTFLGHDRFKQGFGHAVETPLVAGDLLHLTTFWQADTQPAGDYALELRLDGAALGRAPLAGPGYPTSRWLPGLPWRGEHTFALPAELAAGERHRLSLQLFDPTGLPLGPILPLPPDLRF